VNAARRSVVRQSEWPMQARFYAAMTCYAVLALAAGCTLDGKFRITVWILLAAFGVRTYLAALQRR